MKNIVWFSYPFPELRSLNCQKLGSFFWFSSLFPELSFISSLFPELSFISSLFPELWSLKIMCFLQFFSDVSKKSKAVIAMYVYASESSRFALLKNIIAYYTMTWSLKDNSVLSCWILQNFCWVSTFIDIFFLNIVNCCSDPYQTSIFWRRSFRSI